MKIITLKSIFVSLFSYYVISYSVAHASKHNNETDNIQKIDYDYRDYLNIPDEQKIIAFAEGDLNLDNDKDLIIVTENKTQNNIDINFDNPKTIPKRWLYIYVSQRIKTVEGDADDIILKYNNIVSCDNFLDAQSFTGVTIKNGYFSIKYSGSRFTSGIQKIVTFKYSKEKQKWFLYKKGTKTFSTDEPNNSKKSMETTETKKDFGIIPIEKYNVYKDNF